MRIDGFYSGKILSESHVADAYVLFDPQCSDCAAQWQNFEPLQGQVLVKWIPVAVRNEKSAAQAAMLLESEDPTALMAEHEAVFLSENGALAEAVEVSSATRTAIRRNNALLDALGAKTVPTTVYRDSSTGELIVTTGVLTTHDLAHLLGVEPVYPE